MKEIIDITILKKGDNVLFQNRDNSSIKWVGRVNKVNNNLINPSVKMTYLSLFDDGGGIEKEKGSFSIDWNKENIWILYKITKEEVKQYNKELILLSLK